MQNKLNCVASSVLEGSHAEGLEGHENVDAVGPHLAKISVRSSGTTTLGLDLESGCLRSRKSGLPQHTDAIVVEGLRRSQGSDKISGIRSSRVLSVSAHGARRE